MSRVQTLARRQPAARLILLLAALCLTIPAHAQAERPCPFSDSAKSFSGTATEQARCLLRPVRRLGNIGPRRPTLPAPLDQLDQPLGVTREAPARFLSDHRIDAAKELGGALGTRVTAKYFVIHDTSSPLFPFVSNDPAAAENFPLGTIDGPAWSGNNLERWRTSSGDKAHLFVNRMGKSVTTLDFNSARRATKFERNRPATRRGVFLHVENIQPRRTNSRGIDEFSPQGGFTDAQLDRLALAYVAASVRRGQWLIPAFHSVLDVTIPNAHDDPQNFDLDRWAARLGALLDNIRAAQ
ncbi:MAG: hypothetical protein ACRD68_00670 [Pyrinomonadaceae bacterium]